jgi:hypothetical protein
MPESFRFLDLPPELRLMVYETFEVETHRHVLERCESLEHYWPDIPEDPSTVIVIRKCVPYVNLLATSRFIDREVGPYIDRLLMMLEEQPLRFILDCRSFEELVRGGVIATWFERSPRRTLDMHRFPLLPRKTQKLFKSIFSFLKQARNRPLSRTQPFDVQIVLLPDTGSGHAEYVAPEVCRLAWQDNLSISVARKEPWPQGLKKPFSYPWDESSYRKVWEGFSDTVYRHPRTRPAARRLPEPSEEEWTRDWLGDAAA